MDNPQPSNKECPKCGHILEDGRTIPKLEDGKKKRTWPTNFLIALSGFTLDDKKLEDPTPDAFAAAFAFGYLINAATAGNRNDHNDEPEKPPTPPVKVRPPLVVRSVDYHIADNVLEHRTAEYEMASADPPVDIMGSKLHKLIVRRGQKFMITVNFDRNFEEKEDKISLTFDTGRPKDLLVSKGTSKVIPVEKGIRPLQWSAEITKANGKSVTFSVMTDPKSIVGKWVFGLDTMRKDPNSDKVLVNDFTHSPKEPVYLIFNPFNKADAVYLPNEIEREFYTMSDSGKIYSGTDDYVSHKPWGFDQFEDNVLEICLYLLEKSGLSVTNRGNPVAVVRSISRIINSSDDDGVLVGNWSGQYSGGKSPTYWKSSLEILKQYYESVPTTGKPKPVMFGQCWVFSALCTTVARALGIPARSVTNFNSAHDTDGTVTIDYHYEYTPDGTSKILEEYNKDSVWNFHVWNEAWMARNDLGPHNGGWQAFDATPQEASDGLFQAGPCPVRALKRGDLNVGYDAAFIFAEVNADKVYWYRSVEDDGITEKWETKPRDGANSGVGMKISTMKPPKLPGPTGYVPYWDDKDRLDVTEEYKHVEGTEEERAAVLRANQNSPLHHWGMNLPYDSAMKEIKDVDFKIILNDEKETMVGENFTLTLKMQNKSRELRTVDGMMSLRTSTYTGVPRGKIGSPVDFEKVELEPISPGEVVMKIKLEDYIEKIVDEISFLVSVIGTVEETGQVVAIEKCFRLRTPDIVLKVPATAKKGQDFEVEVSMNSPFPKSLTECELELTGPGLINETRHIALREIEPFEQWKYEKTIKMRAKRVGTLMIQAVLDTRELADITGECDIEITE